MAAFIAVSRYPGIAARPRLSFLLLVALFSHTNEIFRKNEAKNHDDDDGVAAKTAAAAAAAGAAKIQPTQATITRKANTLRILCIKSSAAAAHRAKKPPPILNKIDASMMS